MPTKRNNARDSQDARNNSSSMIVDDHDEAAVNYSGYGRQHNISASAIRRD